MKPDLSGAAEKPSLLMDGEINEVALAAGDSIALQPKALTDEGSDDSDADELADEAGDSGTEDSDAGGSAGHCSAHGSGGTTDKGKVPNIEGLSKQVSVNASLSTIFLNRRSGFSSCGK